MKVRCGFTLVEILIVVSILGILAAIVIPQYSSGTTEARDAGLRSNLQIVRKQIALYKLHHHGLWPAAEGETHDDFQRRLTSRTDEWGEPGTQFGPYLERLPTNIFNKLATVRIGGAPAGSNTHGWRFDPSTGQFQADDNHDSNADGVADHVSL
ncbi:MAG: prepilin-type N-terminal cleavage/methylation domain-containing protein [Planctomycetes bacterium]|nr:prepilin-type N-terminal cleavage/methylation domain-containing protein [Planctomycetota bacterium]